MEVNTCVTCTADSAADGTKRPSTPEKLKDKEQADGKEGVKGGDEGPSAEVKKEEGSTDRAEVKPGKERLNTVETPADSKPLGDKYSPKVSP